MKRREKESFKNPDAFNHQEMEEFIREREQIRRLVNDKEKNTE